MSIVKRRFEGCLYKMLPDLENFIRDGIVTKRPVPISILREKDVRNYPYKVLRELMKENEPYQRIVPLEEMIAETFRKPKDGEGRWWGTGDILNLFASRYAYFDAEKTTPNKLGRAMNNYRFNFKHRVVNGLSEYWLCEK